MIFDKVNPLYEGHKMYMSTTYVFLEILVKPIYNPSTWLQILRQLDVFDYFFTQDMAHYIVLHAQNDGLSDQFI